MLARSASESFTVKCTLTKPSQRIVIYAACDNIAGTALRADLRPDAESALDFDIPFAADEFEEVREKFHRFDESITINK